MSQMACDLKVRTGTSTRCSGDSTFFATAFSWRILSSNAYVEKRQPCQRARLAQLAAAAAALPPLSAPRLLR